MSLKEAIKTTILNPIIIPIYTLFLPIIILGIINDSARKCYLYYCRCYFSNIYSSNSNT